jgi:hypothetical protein
VFSLDRGLLMGATISIFAIINISYGYLSKESWPSFLPVGPTARREDQALVGPWKGLLTIVGVETQNSEARSQESE